MRKRKRIAVFAMIAIFGGVLAGCLPDNQSTSSAFCGFVLGDGQDGHDRAIHNIIYPNQNPDVDEDTEVVRYVPCNSRNFIVNDGHVRNANNQRVGDRHTPTLVFTSTGTPIKVSWSAYWTLNESRGALKRFWQVCQKYRCASGSSSSGDANFSTPGWNGMLGENFGPAGDASALLAAHEIGDDIWLKHDPQLYEQLGLDMSKVFADQVRKKTGYNVDLFCGSGNSGFSEPKARKGWTCTNVRFVVDKVSVVNTTLDKQTTEQAQTEVNAARLAAARAIYGPNAEFWLGLQDTIDKCNKARKTTCVVTIGGGSPVVAVPNP